MTEPSTTGPREPEAPPPPAATPEVPWLAGIWARIKEQKVMQWTLAYAAATYTLLHGTEMLSDAQDWSHVIVRMFSLVLILGVPVVVTLAWYHGARRQKRVSGPELAIVTFLGIFAGSVLLALTRPTGAHIATLVVSASSPPAAAATPITAIAVMSFSNLAGDASKDYLGAGMAEEVIDKLTMVPGLNVPAPTSRFVYKGRNTDVRQTAKNLGVDTVLEGSVRSAADRVRTTAQLVDTQRGFHLWSQTYDRRAMELLQKALARDPKYSRAYVGEAAVHRSLPIWASEQMAEGAEAEHLAQQAGPTAFAANEQKLVSHWGVGDAKSYGVPAYDSIGFEFLLNQYDRHFLSEAVYGTNFSTFRHNLGSRWVIDTDPFQVNQFLHPYQGSIFHGFARSAGLGFWESMGYAFGGSLLWKEAGETGKPSINDQITTTFAGPFLGEPLFRMASLLLESGGGEPGFWRELGAAVISPTMGFNRLAFGDRFQAVFPSHKPSFYTRLQVGATLSPSVKSNVNVNPDALGTPVPQAFNKTQAAVDFSMAYGLPGKPGYTYDRPFDYFHFEFEANTTNVFENIISRGLLYGTSYEAGDNYRGIWGLYGSYDYISPQIFRVSSTAASLGTTGEWWLSQAVALQSTALGGVGYGAAGTIHGSGQRDYHYGLTPQGLLALRLILGDRVTFDVTGREFYVSGVASTESRGSENIFRADAFLTLRVYGRQALTLGYVATRRNAHYPDLPDTHQGVGTVSVYYTLLGDTKFGLRDWRSPDTGETEADVP
jgi:TolB-like protein